MRTNTPSLDKQAKTEYIEKHLFNELRWMLGAATEWYVQEQLQLEIVGYDVVVYAMDSAFLHARTLFEFFTKKTNNNHYGCNEFIGKTLPSPKYQGWTGPLHRHLMHAQTRSLPEQLEDFWGGMKDLNKMPVRFALEILRLWKAFEEELLNSDKDLSKLAQDKRREAIERAQCVVKSEVTQKHAERKGIVLSRLCIC
jgi:hypothetical protein